MAFFAFKRVQVLAKMSKTGEMDYTCVPFVAILDTGVCSERFIGIELCRPTEKYNITILHENPDMVDNYLVMMMFLHESPFRWCKHGAKGEDVLREVRALQRRVIRVSETFKES